MMERKHKAALRRKQLREQAIQYLGGRCRICSYDRCPTAFDFHHIQVWAKEFTISDRMTSWEAIQRELDKVILLCARCHREVHDGLHPGYIEFEESNLGGWSVDLEEPVALARPHTRRPGVARKAHEAALRVTE